MAETALSRRIPHEACESFVRWNRRAQPVDALRHEATRASLDRCAPTALGEEVTGTHVGVGIAVGGSRRCVGEPRNSDETERHLSTSVVVWSADSQSRPVHVYQLAIIIRRTEVIPAEGTVEPSASRLNGLLTPIIERCIFAVEGGGGIDAPDIRGAQTEDHHNR